MPKPFDQQYEIPEQGWNTQPEPQQKGVAIIHMAATAVNDAYTYSPRGAETTAVETAPESLEALNISDHIRQLRSSFLTDSSERGA